ncbi:lipid-binding SYLF domain-containing protein [Noviherbaspirillum pedocola]|uniref:Lipid-binding SYLF domain-containing protein n=1 Tax=Noviherbaspirillum pedocola TaxID=2801341 RepID=A0A934T0A0_9BURK|nr:lipid-binding SYLF domain-containing protein [Noviherbaspirillum pedocola]MBK4735008.1 lipid-binding SYLF domain-containing protein [Noviherbaspirillum pedocola]
MMRPFPCPKLFLVFIVMLASMAGTSQAIAKSDEAVVQNSRAALETLYSTTPAARTVAKQAKGILVFPSIYKAGFVVGAQGGNGVLFEDGKVTGHYNTSGLSYGLQAGAQKYGYALFFISQSALDNLKSSAGFELGTGPSIVIVDAGAAKSLTNKTLRNDIYAFIFSQKGLMAGIGLQGTKVTRLNQ